MCVHIHTPSYICNRHETEIFIECRVGSGLGVQDLDEVYMSYRDYCRIVFAHYLTPSLSRKIMGSPTILQVPLGEPVRLSLRILNRHKLQPLNQGCYRCMSQWVNIHARPSDEMSHSSGIA